MTSWSSSAPVLMYINHLLNEMCLLGKTTKPRVYAGTRILESQAIPQRKGRLNCLVDGVFKFCPA